MCEVLAYRSHHLVSCLCHLVCNGFTNDYYKWVLHGEASLSATVDHRTHMQNEQESTIDLHGLLHDAFGIPDKDHEVDGTNPDDVREEPNAEAEKFC